MIWTQPSFQHSIDPVNLIVVNGKICDREKNRSSRSTSVTLIPEEEEEEQQQKMKRLTLTYMDKFIEQSL